MHHTLPVVLVLRTAISSLDEEGDPTHSPHDSSPSHTPSVFSNLEETRVKLESSLGLGTLLQAYRLIQSLYEGEGEAPEEGFPVEQLAAVLGEDHTHHCPALIGLVLADSAYADTNTEGKGQVQLMQLAVTTDCKVAEGN